MARSKTRYDKASGLELCHRRVDGFPCRFILGHAQGCDVDWDAAYPDSEEQ